MDPLSKSDDSILTEPTDRGVRWIMPGRQMVELHPWAWAGIAFAVVGTLFWCGWVAMSHAMIWGANGDVVARIFEIAFTLFGLFGIYLSSKLLTAAVALLRDRTDCVVTMDQEVIQVVDRAGWTRLKRDVDVTSIRALTIESISRTDEGWLAHTRDKINDQWEFANALSAILLDGRNRSNSVPSHAPALCDLRASAFLITLCLKTKSYTAPPSSAPRFPSKMPSCENHSIAVCCCSG